MGQHVTDIASFTLFQGANSWNADANIPGTPRVFMPYIGGIAMYRARCDEVRPTPTTAPFLRRSATAAVADLRKNG